LSNPSRRVTAAENAEDPEGKKYNLKGAIPHHWYEFAMTRRPPTLSITGPNTSDEEGYNSEKRFLEPERGSS
jgi:hypothetical protein